MKVILKTLNNITDDAIQYIVKDYVSMKYSSVLDSTTFTFTLRIYENYLKDLKNITDDAIQQIVNDYFSIKYFSLAI